MPAAVDWGDPGTARRRIDDARVSLRGSPPEQFAWIDRLTPAHQRQFAVELYSALARYNVTEEVDELLELLESWEATAELDAAPDVGRSLRGPKQYREWKSA
jgi:hypothetical protein